jgi:DNA-binding XRE family transcriptional regulator
MGRKPKSEEPVYSRLEEVRTVRGITRQELADAVDVHYQTIGYLERGEYSPSLALALRIARELDTAVGELFSLAPFTTHNPTITGTPLTTAEGTDNHVA